MSHQPKTVRMSADRQTAADRVSRAFDWFASLSAASGVVLLVVTVLAMIWANSPLAHYYHDFFHGLEISVKLG